MATKAKKKITKKKTTAKKTAAKKTTAKTKTAAAKKKTTTTVSKKTAAKKPASRKATTKAKASKKTAAKRASTKKTTAKKATAAKKTPAKAKVTAKKVAAKKSSTKMTAAKKVAKVVPRVKVATAPVKSVSTPSAKRAIVVPKNSESKQYTQAEFYDCMQNYCGFETRKQTKEFYAEFLGMLQKSLKSGYKIPLPGLGKLQVRKTKARMGRNPATQEAIMIPARKKVAFSANKALKDAVL